MYSFTNAVRAETNNNVSQGISALLTKEPLPDRVKHRGHNEHGSWHTIILPASVWALAVSSDEGVTVGIYHSPYLLELELKEAFNGTPIKIKG